MSKADDIRSTWDYKNCMMTAENYGDAYRLIEFNLVPINTVYAYERLMIVLSEHHSDVDRATRIQACSDAIKGWIDDYNS